MLNLRLAGLLWIAPLLSLAGCGGATATRVDAPASAMVQADSAQLVADLAYLSSPALEGRASGSEGNATARRYILDRMRAIGLEEGSRGWTQPFRFGASPEEIEGVNVLGMVPGTDPAAGWLIVSAHYDHLGRRGDVVYPGADDNASGVATVLDAARHFIADRPRHSILFLALDAEERGLVGARHFVDNAPIDLTQVDLEINLDMVSRSQANELYVAGRSSGEGLPELVAEVAANAEVSLIAGHDRETPGLEDWTDASDHGPFNAAGIPWLYFGVEDHADYHKPSDVFENIDPAFLLRSVRTILTAIELADQRL